MNSNDEGRIKIFRQTNSSFVIRIIRHSQNLLLKKFVLRHSNNLSFAKFIAQEIRHSSFG